MAAEQLNLTPIVTCDHPFMLHMQSFCDLSVRKLSEEDPLG